MRKFKLIKKYPGCSYNLREIADQDLTNYSYYENFPENWQEVVEQEYEVLKIQMLNNTSVSADGNAVNLFYTEPDKWKIISIRRISDGEIFSVGDLTNLKNGNGYKNPIKAFRVNNGILEYEVTSIGNIPWGWFNIEMAVHSKKEAFFITEDGVEIEPNAKCYWVCKNEQDRKYTNTFDLPFIYAHIETLKNYKEKYDYKVFSTEKARQEWLDKMYPKPILTTVDGIDIIDKLTIVFCLNKNNWYTWESLAKHLPPHALVFSTEKARENWLIENKPLFSLKDIVDMGYPRGSVSYNRAYESAKLKLNIK